MVRSFAQYGTKGRAQVFSTSVSDYATMNSTKGLVQVDQRPPRLSPEAGRNALVNVRGPKAGHAQCSLLTPAIPGWEERTAFPSNPNLSKARPLVSGHGGDKINYWYTATTTVVPRSSSSPRRS